LTKNMQVATDVCSQDKRCKVAMTNHIVSNTPLILDALNDSQGGLLVAGRRTKT